jgi:hypothetical protein
MPEPYNTRSNPVNKSDFPNGDIAVGSVVRFVRPWREDELPCAENFQTARVDGVRRSPGGFPIYETARGDVWFDRVLDVVSAPAAALAA